MRSGTRRGGYSPGCDSFEPARCDEHASEAAPGGRHKRNGVSNATTTASRRRCGPRHAMHVPMVARSVGTHSASHSANSRHTCARHPVGVAVAAMMTVNVPVAMNVRASRWCHEHAAGGPISPSFSHPRHARPCGSGSAAVTLGRCTLGVSAAMVDWGAGGG